MPTQPQPVGSEDDEIVTVTIPAVASPVGATAEVERFLNRGYGIIGRTASTRFEANTSSRFLFWMADRGKVPEAEGGTEGALEIGNIVAACDDDESDITFGSIVEMRSYSDVESFISDYLSHNFGDAAIEVPTDVSEVVVVTCNVMRNLPARPSPSADHRCSSPMCWEPNSPTALWMRKDRASLPALPFQSGYSRTATVQLRRSALMRTSSSAQKAPT